MQGEADGDGQQGDAGGEGDGDAGSGAVLDAVLERGTVRCGVNDVLPGFGIVDDAGEYAGFDVDFCRAVAAGVLGDPAAVEFVLRVVRALHGYGESAQRLENVVHAIAVDTLMNWS